MANMSYCRFENTVRDLQDCYNAMSEEFDGENQNELSPSEESAKKHLIALCKDIVELTEEN